MKKNKIIVLVAAIVVVICGVTFAVLSTQSNNNDESDKVATTNNNESTPETPYTTDHNVLVDLASEEQDNDTRPALKDEITNFDEYDVIFVGYPIWWSDMPQILYTFLEAYDFEGKTVIPFSTHGGSGLAGTVGTIQNKLNNSTVIENALSISRNDMEDAPEEVQEWLQELNVLK